MFWFGYSPAHCMGEVSVVHVPLGGRLQGGDKDKSILFEQELSFQLSAENVGTLRISPSIVNLLPLALARNDSSGESTKCTVQNLNSG